MLKSLIVGCILQAVIWLISFFMQDLTWADTLSFYLVGSCILLVALPSLIVYLLMLYVF